MNVRAAIVAGVVAAILSTAVQVALWIALTDAFPAILFRDARMAAAIVAGRGALDAQSGLGTTMLIGTLVHFALSIAYGLAVALWVGRKRMAVAATIGAGFGVLLYVVNLHAFTALFPWFTVARDAITFAAHIAFGLSAALTYSGLVGATRLPRSRSA
jgi:hypothetical protein